MNSRLLAPGHRVVKPLETKHQTNQIKGLVFTKLHWHSKFLVVEKPKGSLSEIDLRLIAHQAAQIRHG